MTENTRAFRKTMIGQVVSDMHWFVYKFFSYGYA